jgi:hypothetical protein
MPHSLVLSVPSDVCHTNLFARNIPHVNLGPTNLRPVIAQGKNIKEIELFGGFLRVEYPKKSSLS